MASSLHFTKKIHERTVHLLIKQQNNNTNEYKWLNVIGFFTGLARSKVNWMRYKRKTHSQWHRNRENMIFKLKWLRLYIWPDQLWTNNKKKTKKKKTNIHIKFPHRNVNVLISVTNHSTLSFMRDFIFLLNLIIFNKFIA